uniref:Uncharacterized protein n=1 Tax=Vespula pensylvanica TaxID=30213 RepID=A0A834KNC2_VESPE|nr:hypothetical protein H0235_013706 [Vespula pensylvanica]
MLEELAIEKEEELINTVGSLDNIQDEISLKDNDVIVVLKWRDVRDVKILSSKRISIMVSNMDSSYRNRLPKINPLAVTAYNNKSLGSTETIKWYHMQQQYGKGSNGLANWQYIYL